DERIELLEGGLVTMSPQGDGHMAVIRKLNYKLQPALVGRAIVQVQGPLAVSDDSEPEPDIALVRVEEDDKHPTTSYLIIEVADDSLSKDRKIKARLYAAAGVPEYWIVNLKDDVLEVMRAPRGKAYSERRELRRGDSIAIERFSDVVVSVDEILPKR